MKAPASIPLEAVARMTTAQVRELLGQHQDLLGSIGSLIENVRGLGDLLAEDAQPFAELVAPVLLANQDDGGPAVDAWKDLVDRKDWQQATVALGAMCAVSLLTSLRLSVVLAQREVGAGPVPPDPPNPN